MPNYNCRYNCKNLVKPQNDRCKNRRLKFADAKLPPVHQWKNSLQHLENSSNSKRKRRNHAKAKNAKIKRKNLAKEKSAKRKRKKRAREKSVKRKRRNLAKAKSAKRKNHARAKNAKIKRKNHAKEKSAKRKRSDMNLMENTSKCSKICIKRIL